MATLLFVAVSKESTDHHNLLNTAQGKQDLPEGVEFVSATTWQVEFPKCAVFLSRLVVAAEEKHLAWRLFEIVTPSQWQK